MTAWGMAEISGNETLGRSMLYKLIHRAFPRWFKFNSIYIMQPMYTPKINEEIAKEFGTFDQYCLDGPAPPSKIAVLSTQSTISALLDGQSNFTVKYGLQLPDLVSSAYPPFSDSSRNRDTHKITEKTLIGCLGSFNIYG